MKPLDFEGFGQWSLSLLAELIRQAPGGLPEMLRHVAVMLQIDNGGPLESSMEHGLTLRVNLYPRSGRVHHYQDRISIPHAMLAQASSTSAVMEARQQLKAMTAKNNRRRRGQKHGITVPPFVPEAGQ